MSIIAGVIGSIHSGGASQIGGYNDSSFARPGWPGDISYRTGQFPSTYGTAYDPGGNVSSVPGTQIIGALRRVAYYGNWAPNGGSRDPSVFNGTQQEILNDQHINFDSDNRAEYYALEWKGYWKPNQTGNWNFSCAADDVCWVWLGSAALAPDDNNSLTNTSHGINPNSVSLTADQWYPIRIRYQEWGGGETNWVWAGLAGTELLGFDYWAANGALAWNGNSDGY